MLGRYVSLSPEDLAQIQTLKGKRLFARLQELENERRCFDLDKAWRAIDNALAASGSEVLEKTVLGGKCLRPRAQDVFLLEPSEVAQVWKELAPVNRQLLHVWFMAPIREDRYSHPQTEEEFEYLWPLFEDLPEFFGEAARAGHGLIFTVS